MELDLWIKLDIGIEQKKKKKKEGIGITFP